MKDWQRFFSAEGLSHVILVGLLFITILLLLRFLARRYRLLRRLPPTVRRLLPWLEAVAGFGFLLWAIRHGLETEIWAKLLSGGLVVAVFLFFSWYFLRDFIAGLLLKAEGTLKLEQTCRMGEMEGEIVRLGRRSLRLRTAAGALVQVPYSQIAGRAFSRQPERAEAFRVEVRTDLPEAQVLQHLRQLITYAPVWTYTRRPPVVRLLERRGEITTVEVFVTGFSENEREQLRAYVEKHWTK